MNDGAVDLFSWAEEQDSVHSTPPSVKIAAVHPFRLRQAALAFLAARNPDGLAADVPPRFRNYRVAAAAFWRRPHGRSRPVTETAVVQVFDRHDRCFAECADRQQLLAAIHALRVERENIEAEIRRTEPHLGDSDTLFPEFRTWRYRESERPDYRRLCRKLDLLLRTLYHGSRIEHVMRSECADHLYLAVPAHAVAPDELAEEWGLIYVDEHGSSELVREAALLPCTPAARSHLALNIAQAAKCSVLFSRGVVGGGSHFRCIRPPKRRRY